MKINPKKLVIIGAGSMAALRIVYRVCEYSKQFGPTCVVLYDRLAGRAQIMARLCRLMPEFDPDSIEVKVAADLSEALQGADAVYCMLRLDFGAEQAEVQSCLENGIYGNATFGPSSVMLALRHGPVMLDIARQMERHCPQATFFIFTNPVTMLTDLVGRYTAIRTIGVCPGVENIKSDMLQLHYDSLGPIKGLVYRGGGLNHFSWVSKDSTYNGELLAEYMKKYINTIDESRVPPWCLWRYEKPVFELTGQMPMNNGHFYHFFFYDEFVADEQQRLSANREKGQHAPDPWQERDRISRQTHIPGYWDYFGVKGLGLFVECPGVKAMFSAWYDLGWEASVNIPNRGHVADLPEGCIVEATCRVMSKGCEPLGLDPIPECVKGITQAVAFHQKMVADLVLNPTLKGLKETVFADPCHRNLKNVEKVTSLLWDLFTSNNQKTEDNERRRV